MNVRKIYIVILVLIALLLQFNCSGKQDKTPPYSGNPPNQNDQPAVDEGTTDLQDSQTDVSPESDASVSSTDASSSSDVTVGQDATTATKVDAGPPKNDCCTASTRPGCNDHNTQACVCNEDITCCEEAWDNFCVLLVEEFKCSTCPDEPAPAPQTSTCCTVQTTPGCDDKTVESCVCDLEPTCCQEDWDAFCVMLVTTETGGNPACGACES